MVHHANEARIKLANITTTLTRFENMGENTILTGKLMVNEERPKWSAAGCRAGLKKLYFKETGQRIVQGQALYEIYSEPLLLFSENIFGPSHSKN